MAAGKLSREKEEEIRSVAQHRVECERKAFNVVVKLVEFSSAADGELEEVACYLTPDHYSDVIEERSISGFCGYPLCPNPLKDVPAQKYHISVQQKQIFDITERKKFCSSLCYKASVYYSSQLSEAPLWLREQERPVKVTLMDHRQTSQGCVSSSDDVASKKLPSDVRSDTLAHTVKEKLVIETCSKTSCVGQDRKVDGEGLDDGDSESKSSIESSLTSTTSAYTRLPKNTLEVDDGSGGRPAEHTVRGTAASTSSKAGPHVWTSVNKRNTQQYASPSQSDNPLLCAYRVLSEWCQPETCWLLGEGWSERDVSHLSYAEASLVELRRQKDRTEQPVNLTGDSSQVGAVCGGVKEVQHLHDPVLPPVDSASQILVRRRIVLQKVLPVVQSLTKLAPHQVTSDVTALVESEQYLIEFNGVDAGDDCPVILASVLHM